MKQISRYIMTLVALFAMTAGAWAQEETLLTTIVNTGDNASFKSGSKTFDNIATVTFSGTVYNDGDGWGWYSEEERTLTVTAAEGYTITRVKFYTYEGSAFDEEAPFEAILVDDDYEGNIAKVNGTSIGGNGVTKIEVYGYAGTPAPAEVNAFGVKEIVAPAEWASDETNATEGDFPGFDGITIEEAKTWTGAPSSGTAILFYNIDGETISYAVFEDGGFMTNASQPIERMQIYSAIASGTPHYYTTPAPTSDGPEVTTNAAQDGESFTTASFDMPGNDVTIEYELVRDMAINMTASVGDGTDGYRIRLKKEGDAYVLAEMTVEEVMNFVKVYDQTEEKYLTLGTDFTTAIYAIDDNGQPTGDAIAFASLTPGRYVAIATAVDESNYAGTAPQSNVFVLYEAYELTVPAGEYVTYYCDEALTLDTDETAAELYTITEVSEETATASKFDVIPANVPLLVKNTSDETRTIVLIPTEDPASFMWYEGFKGTLEATEIAASDDTADRYAFNGKQFVRVENALAVAANRAWLEIPAAANNARTINLVFGETTKITTTDFTDYTDGVFYDLNGRKLQNIPTKKGVYIMNGKKVVVK